MQNRSVSRQKSHRLWFLLASLFTFALVMVSAQDVNSWLRPCNLKNELPPPAAGKVPECDLRADYIVVGMGGAGSALARLLSDNNHYSVIGVEAGHYRDDDPNIQSAFGSQVVSNNGYSTYMYQFKSAFEPVVGKTFDVFIGRGSGGSTGVNGMQFVRGSTPFFQDWERYGGPEWSPTNITEAYKNMETYNGQSPIGATRGTSGLVNSRGPAVGPTTGAGSFAYKIANWTATASGIPITTDYNDVNQFGPFARFDLFQNPDGSRCSSSSAYLPPSVLNKNGTSVGTRKLRVFFKTTATKIIFVGKRAIGIEVMREGSVQFIRANKEVIVANSLFAVQLLQNSGIGPAQLLESKGVEVLLDNQHVGRHSFNHQSMFLAFGFNPAHLPSAPGTDYQSLYPGGIFLPSWTATGPVDTAELQHPRKYQLIWVGPYEGSPVLLAFIIQLRPNSEGTVEIQSKDPFEIPLYNENTFSDIEDLNDFAKFLYYGIQNTLSAHMVSQDASYVPYWAPWSSLEETKQHVKSNLLKSYHYTSTLRMSLNATSGVVDPKGRVWGITGLRVAGSPIIPSSVDGNTGAASIMTGAKIAQFIIADRRPTDRFFRRK